MSEENKSPFWFRVFGKLNRMKLINWMSDKTFLRIFYYGHFRKSLNLNNPETYNEKLQWLKLFDRREIYSVMVDKYEAKGFISSIIGEQYVIPTIGVWDTFDEIDFDSLPMQFVLKCTHDCGGLIICKDKNDLDLDLARKKINKCLKTNYYYKGREWPYKNVKPRIIAETYMENSETNDLRDYKFFCFDGEPKYLFIATERQSETEDTKFDFFDMNYEHLDIRNGHPNASVPPKKPECFEEMKRLAANLSKGIPQIRVDFYEVDGRVYVGELTLFHWSGAVPFEPEEWDYKFGELINLPLS